MSASLQRHDSSLTGPVLPECWLVCVVVSVLACGHDGPQLMSRVVRNLVNVNTCFNGIGAFKTAAHAGSVVGGLW
jgi:hypothetical protein